jgi:hypothetical protein
VEAVEADEMVLIVAVAVVAIAAVSEGAVADLATDKGTLRDTLYTLPPIRK